MLRCRDVRGAPGVYAVHRLLSVVRIRHARCHLLFSIVLPHSSRCFPCIPLILRMTRLSFARCNHTTGASPAEIFILPVDAAFVS